MNRRGKRLAFTVTATGVVVLLIGLATAYRDAIRIHLKAWHFQLSTDTETIEPILGGRESILAAGPVGTFHFDLKGCLSVLATYSSLPVVFDPAEDLKSAFMRTAKNPAYWTPSASGISADSARRVLEGNGWRIIEQRFPRRAYVVIRDQGATP